MMNGIIEFLPSVFKEADAYVVHKETIPCKNNASAINYTSKKLQIILMDS